MTFRDGINKGEAYFDWTTYQYIDPNAGNTTGLNDGVITSADIMQINSYYPFGLNMEGNWNGAAGNNKYAYNGKEWNDDFGLGWNDYGARFYDPAIARWGAVDPLSENYMRQSPFNYVGNNPIKRIDPDGKKWADPNSENTAKDIEQNIQGRLSQLGSNLASKEASLNSVKNKIGNSSSKVLNFFRNIKANSLEKQISGIKESASELRKSSNELAVMGDQNNERVFKFEDIKGSTGFTSIGMDGIITMQVVDHSTNGVHESKHGFQLYSGVKTDEIDPYRAQFAMTPNSLPPSIGGTVANINDINTLYTSGIYVKKPNGEIEYPYKPSTMTNSQFESIINNAKKGKHE